MLEPESETFRSLRSQLRKAENREKVAQCKLENLKKRLDRMQEDIEDEQKLQAEIALLRAEKERAEQESAMWRAQLFERMELLDKTKASLASASQDLQVAEARAAHASETHHASHQELRRRDRERQSFELKIGELQAAHQASCLQVEDLLSALNDARQAIESLQRSNDFHERQSVGLRAIGSSLTEKLTQVTQQRDNYRDQLQATTQELRSERAESTHFLNVIEQLKDELWETKSKLVSSRMEAEVQEIRHLGAEKSHQAAQQKYAEFPSTESVVDKTDSRSLLSRAGKKVSGWFKLSDEVNKVSRN